MGSRFTAARHADSSAKCIAASICDSGVASTTAADRMPTRPPAAHIMQDAKHPMPKSEYLMRTPRGPTDISVICAPMRCAAAMCPDSCIAAASKNAPRRKSAAILAMHKIRYIATLMPRR